MFSNTIVSQFIAIVVIYIKYIFQGFFFPHQIFSSLATSHKRK